MKTFKTSDDAKDLEFKSYRKTALAHAVKIDEPFAVETLEGTMEGQAGDMLMKGVAGELYPCAAEIFAKTYELVNPGVSSMPKSVVDRWVGDSEELDAAFKGFYNDLSTYEDSLGTLFDDLAPELQAELFCFVTSLLEE